MWVVASAVCSNEKFEVWGVSVRCEVRVRRGVQIHRPRQQPLVAVEEDHVEPVERRDARAAARVRGSRWVAATEHGPQDGGAVHRPTWCGVCLAPYRVPQMSHTRGIAGQGHFLAGEGSQDMRSCPHAGGGHRARGPSRGHFWGAARFFLALQIDRCTRTGHVFKRGYTNLRFASSCTGLKIQLQTECAHA